MGAGGLTQPCVGGAEGGRVVGGWAWGGDGGRGGWLSCIAQQGRSMLKQNKSD